MRDYLHKNGGKNPSDDEDFAERYVRLFPDLRSRIEDFGGFRNLNDSNYDVFTEVKKANLRNNLVNTEIDIVLESPNSLFIGEAKHEMSFGADGTLVLVHQLIRQYVVARILVDRLECDKEVVPFVVGDDAKQLRKSHQVGFMTRQGWMTERNILEWRDVEDLARNP